MKDRETTRGTTQTVVRIVVSLSILAGIVAVRTPDAAAADHVGYPVIFRLDEMSGLPYEGYCGDSEGYVAVRIGTRNWRKTPTYYPGSDGVAKPFYVMGETYSSPTTVPIRISLWDDDSNSACNGNDHLDVGPAGDFDIDLWFDLRTCRIWGDIQASCGDRLTSLSGAADPDIIFRISRGCERSWSILTCAGPEFTNPDGTYNLSYVREMVMPPSGRGIPTLRGKIDFATYYPLDPSGATIGGASHADTNSSFTPRPLRGMVKMDAAGLMSGLLSPSSMASQIGTLNEEYEHAWAVPSNATVAGTPPPTLDEIERAINDGQPVPDLAITGRNDAGPTFRGTHWSAFLDGDGSPLDAVNYEYAGTEGTMERWQTQSPTRSFSTTAGNVQVSRGYSDLDLYFMGILNASQAYPEAGNTFRYMTPKITTPANYHLGLVLAFDENDMVYFGPYRDFRTVAFQRTGQSSSSQVVFDPSFQPFGANADRILLRINRKGNTYCFQAYGQRGSAPFATTALAGTTSDCPASSTTGALGRWTTVGRFTTSETPKAIGFITKTWDDPPVARSIDPYAFASFERLYLRAGTTYTTSFTDTQPGTVSGNDYLDRVDNTLRAHIPLCDQTQTNGCTKVRSRNGRIEIIKPVGLHGDHWIVNQQMVDQAPKVLRRAPAGDFSFGSIVRTESVLLSVLGGGAWYGQPGRVLIGTARKARVADYVPRRLDRLPPPNNTFRSAYIALAAQKSHVPGDLVVNIAYVRDAYERYFPEATTRQICSSAECTTVRRFMDGTLRDEWYG